MVFSVHRRIRNLDRSTKERTVHQENEKQKVDRKSVVKEKIERPDLNREGHRIESCQDHKWRLCDESGVFFMSSAYCYVLYSLTHSKHYTRSNRDIERKMSEHNSCKDKFTSTGLPWSLVYIEESETLTEARRRQQYIKRMKSRK